MPHATLIALPGSLASSISLSAEMLAAANDMARRANLHRKTRYAELTVEISSLDKGPIQGKGLCLYADRALETIKHSDLIILPALWRNPLSVLTRYADALQHQLTRLRQPHTAFCAVGTSSFFFAEMGWLNDKPATTHWSYFDVFEKKYPLVHLKREFLITEANHLFCAGSINAVADLMIHFIEQFFDRQIAMSVASQFSPEIRRPIELYGHRQNHYELHSDEAIIEAQEWLLEHMSQKVNLKDLSQTLGMAYRNFTRRFKLATGMTPIAYLQHIRVHQARELLKTSNLSIGEIANQVGFEDSSYFCELFKRSSNQTPQSYRESVRSKLFHVMTQSQT